jgi:hypothetical protein
MADNTTVSFFFQSGKQGKEKPIQQAFSGKL